MGGVDLQDGAMTEWKSLSKGGLIFEEDKRQAWYESLKNDYMSVGGGGLSKGRGLIKQDNWNKIEYESVFVFFVVWFLHLRHPETLEHMTLISKEMIS